MILATSLSMDMIDMSFNFPYFVVDFKYDIINFNLLKLRSQDADI